MVRTISNALRDRPHPAGLGAHRRARRRQNHDGAHSGPRAQLRTAGRLDHRPDRSTCRCSACTARRSWKAAISTSSRWTPPPTTASTTCAQINEAVRYAPVSARYKVYILDEVHMLSGAAFNALLKTLEEPPPHAKFIFATTEIRKVPITVLSRCQRFDLRRVDADAAGQAPARHRRQGSDRGRAGGAGADRARRRRLGARRAVAARPGDRRMPRGPGARRRRAAACSALPTAPASSICSKR